MQTEKSKQTQQTRDEILCELLKNEFQKRAQKNPAFSLRALSQKMGVDQSLLSKLLSGKRKFSKENSEKVSAFLGIHLIENVVDHGVDHAVEKIKFNLLKEDQFLLLAAWYHFAILELVKTSTFEPSIHFISQELNISEADAKMAIERLTRLNMLEIKRHQWIVKSAANNWVDQRATSSARKNLQKILLEKAVEALEEVPLEDRNHSNMMIAVDSSQLPAIKKKIDDFTRELASMIVKHNQQKGTAKDVYNLSLAFYPLTNLKKKK